MGFHQGVKLAEGCPGDRGGFCRGGFSPGGGLRLPPAALFPAGGGRFTESGSEQGKVDVNALQGRFEALDAAAAAAKAAANAEQATAGCSDATTSGTCAKKGS